jgi:hypothetical protein
MTASKGRGPVGRGDYHVHATDCLASIAYAHGHISETIWNDPANAELKRTRKDPNVLLEGDKLTIPPIRPKMVPAATEQRHRFRRKDVPSRLNVRLLLDDEPRTDVPYSLDIDGKTVTGRTDSDGWVRAAIDPDARVALLTLSLEGEEPETYRLVLGGLDPVEEPRGQRARLRNLGLFAGDVDHADPDELRQALSAFQQSRRPDRHADPDDATLEALKNLHKS